MSNQIEIQKRIRIIADELENCLTNAELVQKYCEEWGIGESTLHRYISLAKDIVHKRVTKRDTILENVRCEIIASEAEHLRSNLELEARLVSLIESEEPELEKIITHSHGGTTVRSRVPHRDVIRAIDTIWKRRGQFGKKEIIHDRPMNSIYVISEEAKKKMEEYTLPEKEESIYLLNPQQTSNMSNMAS